MTPGEVFAVTSSGKTANYLTEKDYIDITLGHDFNFSNVESRTLTSANGKYYDGATVDDTDIQLFGENEISFTIRQGLLPALKLGSWKVRAEALDEFLRQYECYDLSDLSNICKVNYYT